MTTKAKNALILAMCLAWLILAILLTGPKEAGSTTLDKLTVATSTPTLSRPQKAWLGALEWCESRGQPGAINPKDLDNTPSYGLLQFKPETFITFAKLYGITSTSTMDADAQEAIVTQMILRGGVNWHQQFPDCVKRLGLPPVSVKI